MNVSAILGDWYDGQKRDLPWRKTNDPYKIWVSEIILQQTRVKQGLNYYLKFIDRFPTIISLANAPINDVLLNWQGLGYYTRARNMHKAACILRDQFNCRFPHEYKEILALPGIGEYTAAAIASIAFQQPFAVIDGNVFRFLSRYFGVFAPIDIQTGKNEFKKIANSLIPHKNPGRFNESIMEFGALICKPKNPDCIICPFQSSCIAYKENVITQLPVKSKTINIAKMYLHYLVFQHKQTFYLQQRPENNIWALLYEFPCIEWNFALNALELSENINYRHMLTNNIGTINPKFVEYKHQLTHKNIVARFFSINVHNTPSINNLVRVNCNNITNYPLPRLIEKYIHEVLNVNK